MDFALGLEPASEKAKKRLTQKKGRVVNMQRATLQYTLHSQGFHVECTCTFAIEEPRNTAGTFRRRHYFARFVVVLAAEVNRTAVTEVPHDGCAAHLNQGCAPHMNLPALLPSEATLESRSKVLWDTNALTFVVHDSELYCTFA